ncbi:hypothetical protein N9X62_00980 [Candidatus Poseidoniales archaeon]|nr:hypothetical protein [Candidatus Poseidoniales archaeon]
MKNSTYPCEECLEPIHWGDHVCTHCSAYQYSTPDSLESTMLDPSEIRLKEKPTERAESHSDGWDNHDVETDMKTPGDDNSYHVHSFQDTPETNENIISFNLMIDQIRTRMLSSIDPPHAHWEDRGVIRKAQDSMFKAISKTIPGLDTNDVLSIISHIRGVWEPNKLYKSGEFLIRMHFKDTKRHKVVYVVTMWSQQSHIDANPIHFLSNLGKPNNQQWMMSFAQYEPDGGQANKVLDGDGTIVPFGEHYSQSKEKEDDVVCCEQCESEDRLKLKTETTGRCNYCLSTKFLFGDKMITYDIHKKGFFTSLLPPEDQESLEGVWLRLNVGSHQETMDLETYEDHQLESEHSAKVTVELISLETKLHQSSAALYSKLRSIGLSYPNNLAHGPEILRELDWINSQIERIMVKLE